MKNKALAALKAAVARGKPIDWDVTAPPKPKLLNVGDRVMLTCDTLMDKAGAIGTVVRKYVPAHCTGVWDITVRWDGNKHDTVYPYPTGGLVVHDTGWVDWPAEETR